MAFRDRPPTCPRCRGELTRDSGGRSRWTCSHCRGMALSVAELVSELIVVAPDLIPSDGFLDVATPQRVQGVPLPCPLCGSAMQPVFLGGADVDRCRPDGVIWFDTSEIDRAIAAAASQHDQRSAGLLGRLIEFLTR